LRILKQVLVVLGTAAGIAAILVLVTPKTAHSLVATLVQIVPGTSTHVGTTESQLVSLVCNLGAIATGGGLSGTCEAVDPTGGVSGSSYEVPAGFTLIITDYEWQQTVNLSSTSSGSTTPGTYLCDYFLQFKATSIFPIPITLLPQQSCALADKAGLAYGREHFTTGIRVASGIEIFDNLSGTSLGSAALQGYLVPN
jgi:hypothetical protein